MQKIFLLTLVVGLATSKIVEFTAQSEIDELLDKHQFAVIHYFNP